MRQKKGQAAVEYMIVVAVSVLMIVSMSYFFFIYNTDATDDVMKEEIDMFAEQIIANAEEVYFTSGASKKTLMYALPQSVIDIYVENQRYLVFRLADGSEMMYESRVPFYSFFGDAQTYSGVICIQKIPTRDGREENVVICGIGECSCHIGENETLGECSDRDDNDIDGKYDGQDFDCCPDDSDGDGYTDARNTTGPFPFAWQNCTPLFGKKADDCNDSDPTVYPGAPEFCDMIDHDCDGNPHNVYGCMGYGLPPGCEGGLCLYLEQAYDEGGQYDCIQPNFEPILSVSSPINAHVQKPEVHPTQSYHYDVCYLTTTGTCTYECEWYNGPSDCDPDIYGVCDQGNHNRWTLIASINQSLPTGSHIEFRQPNPDAYPDELYCERTCSGTHLDIRCELRDGPCNSDESTLFSLYSAQNSHFSENNTLLKNICCR